jgi:hypothetical protein
VNERRSPALWAENCFFSSTRSKREMPANSESTGMLELSVDYLPLNDVTL